jgi:glycosyltransferase involved in cell wall biosynthesis
MKIAFILPSLANAGPIIVARDIVNVMIQHGHLCEVFYFHNKIEIEFPCPVSRISFFHQIDYNKYDVVHSHCIVSDLYQFLHKPFRKSRAKAITTVHNFIFEDIHSYHNFIVAEITAWLWLISLSRLDCVAHLSHTAVAYYSRWCNANKMKVAYNTSFIDSSLKLSQKEKTELLDFKGNNKLLGINASLLKRKGIDQVIKVMPYLKDLKLYIVGSGNQESELKQLVADLKLSERVHFAGYVKYAYRYLEYYDLYVMSSRSEGFPLCIIEAIRANVKTVCSDIPLFRELLDDTETTFFELDNGNSLVKAINYAMSNSKVENAYNRFVKNYSVDSFYKNYLRIYTE